MSNLCEDILGTNVPIVSDVVLVDDDNHNAGVLYTVSGRETKTASSSPSLAKKIDDHDMAATTSKERVYRGESPHEPSAEESNKQRQPTRNQPSRNKRVMASVLLAY